MNRGKTEARTTYRAAVAGAGRAAVAGARSTAAVSLHDDGGVVVFGVVGLVWEVLWRWCNGVETCLELCDGGEREAEGRVLYTRGMRDLCGLASPIAGPVTARLRPWIAPARIPGV